MSRHATMLVLLFYRYLSRSLAVSLRWSLSTEGRRDMEHTTGKLNQ